VVSIAKHVNLNAPSDVSAATETISEDSKNLIHPFTGCKVSNDVTNAWSTYRAQLQLLFISLCSKYAFIRGGSVE